MLPEVGSTIVPPGFSFPSRSASSIIVSADPVLDRAARVHVLELGEDRVARVLGHDILSSRTSGVSPTSSSSVGYSRAIAGEA